MPTDDCRNHHLLGEYGPYATTQDAAAGTDAKAVKKKSCDRLQDLLRQGRARGRRDSGLAARPVTLLASLHGAGWLGRLPDRDASLFGAT